MLTRFRTQPHRRRTPPPAVAAPWGRILPPLRGVTRSSIMIVNPAPLRVPTGTAPAFCACGVVSGTDITPRTSSDVRIALERCALAADPPFGRVVMSARQPTAEKSVPDFEKPRPKGRIFPRLRRSVLRLTSATALKSAAASRASLGGPTHSVRSTKLRYAGGYPQSPQRRVERAKGARAVTPPSRREGSERASYAILEGILPASVIPP